MPREFGSESAIHAYFQEWAEKGVFETFWQRALNEYDELKGIQWRWQSMDGAMTKAPLGGEKMGGEKNREEPHGSRQAGSEALDAHRWAGRAAGGGHRRRQCA